MSVLDLTMDTICHLENIAEGEAGSSSLATRRRASSNAVLSSRATQEFHDVHISDNAKVHIGHVYHNDTYASMNETNASKAKADNLVAALEFDGMRDRLYTVSPACANTCSWFLETEEYIRWRDPASRAEHNGVLWIKGKAGTGKSTLMRYIHDQAYKKSKDRTTISFFFNARSPDALLKSTEGMYRSLLY